MKVRRTVWLDRELLSWALAVLKDNRFDVERRGDMSDDWRKKYDDAQTHLLELIKKAQVSK